MGHTEIPFIMQSEKNGCFANGVFEGKGLTVYAGSQVSTSVHNSIRENLSVMRSMHSDEEGRTLTDLYFNSPSAANNFVCGRSSNGWIEWVTPDGIKLSAYRDHGVSSVDTLAEASVPAVSSIDDKQENGQAQKVSTESALQDPIIHDSNATVIKMLVCADLRLGAVCAERLDMKQSHTWQAARNEKYAGLIDAAARSNAAYIALWGHIFGQGRVTESVIDTFFQAIREESAITVLAFLSTSEYKRISYRSDIPENLHMFNMLTQNSFMDDRIALQVKNNTVELQFADHSAIIVSKDEAEHYTLNGISGNNVIPSFEPTGFEDAQNAEYGYGMITYGKNKVERFEIVHDSKYAYKSAELKILPEDNEDEILRKINNLIRSIERNTFLRVTLTGRSAFGLTISSDALKSQLRSKIFYVEVYDNTVMDIDEEAFETDISLRSEFVRLALQDGSLSESERNRLISLGWNALSGSEVSAE